MLQSVEAPLIAFIALCFLGGVGIFTGYALKAKGFLFIRLVVTRFAVYAFRCILQLIAAPFFA